MKVDQEGRVFCTGPGGIWVHEPDGTHIGIIRLPEMAVNFAFGGNDLTTLFVCAVTSVYTLQVKTPGLPHPWYLVREMRRGYADTDEGQMYYVEAGDGPPLVLLHPHRNRAAFIGG